MTSGGSPNGIQDWVEGFLFDGTFLLVGEDGSVVDGRGSPVLTWATGRIWVNNHAHVLVPSDDSIGLRFLYYFLQTVNIRGLVTGSAQPKLNQASMNRIQVAVPPMEVQREIVRVLDLFQSLEARCRQYAHYRDSLMTFGESVPRIPIGELGEIYRGRRFTKEDYVSEGLPAIHYGELYTQYAISATVAVTHVRPDLEPILRFAQPGDVVIAEVGETVEDVGKAAAWLGDTKVAIHDGCYGFRHSMNPKFVAYYLQTASYHAEKSRHVARAKVNRLSMTGINRSDFRCRRLLTRNGSLRSSTSSMRSSTTCPSGFRRGASSTSTTGTTC